MSQLFPRGADTALRLGLAVLVALVVLPLVLAGTLARSSWSTRIGVAVNQPIQFSHERHVAGNGLDCRYCHAAVEEAAFAGIPPTRTCMNCHAGILADAEYLAPVRASYRTNTPLRWERVYDLPDFVYFNHAIHVAKGVGCETCHGRVDRMPLIQRAVSLQMDWCLECHRDPAPYLRPREEVFTMGYRPAAGTETGQQLRDAYGIREPAALTDCYVCHR